MSQLIIPEPRARSQTQSYPFYLHKIDHERPLQRLEFNTHNKVELTRGNLLTRHMSLFDRAVVYLSPQHQKELNDQIKLIEGFEDYLKGCEYLFTDDKLQDAFYLLQKAAHKNFAAAQYLIGYCYLHGFQLSETKQISINDDAAIGWLKEAASYGHLLSIRHLELIKQGKTLPHLQDFFPTSSDEESEDSEPSTSPTFDAIDNQYRAIFNKIMMRDQAIIQHIQYLHAIFQLKQKTTHHESLHITQTSLLFVPPAPIPFYPLVHKLEAQESAPKRQRTEPPVLE